LSLDVTLLEPGFSLGMSHGTLEVRQNGATLQSIPLHRIRSLSIGPGISFSSDLAVALADLGVHLLALDAMERPGAVLVSPSPWRDPRLLRGQALALQGGAAVAVVRQLIQAKVCHQGRLLRLWARNVDPGGPVRGGLADLGRDLDGFLEAIGLASGLEEIRGLEAQAARLYWKGVSLVIPFQGRRYPNAPDLANRLLNYGYAVLARAWLRIVLLAGLEPHLGMLHADRQGRPSLVLDLMEPWRPWVDRTIVGLLRQRVPLSSDDVGLSLDTRHRLIAALNRAFSARSGSGAALRDLWLANTRHLGAHLADGRPWRCPRLHP